MDIYEIIYTKIFQEMMKNILQKNLDIVKKLWRGRVWLFGEKSLEEFLKSYQNFHFLHTIFKTTAHTPIQQTRKLCRKK